MTFRDWTLAALIVGFQCAGYAQASSTQSAPGKQPGPANMPQASALPQQTSAIPQPVTSDDKIVARLDGIEAGIAKLTEKAAKTDYLTPVLGIAGSLVGVVVGGLITLRTQRRLATQQWQLKQLSELYGPLHALLLQSNTMYRLMNDVLERANKAKFRLKVGSPGDDFDDKVFEINQGGEWVRFRTIMHIGEVYGRGYGVEDYFDEIVAIGGRMVSVIEKNAGLVRRDQAALTPALGKYLAHYLVLKHVHAPLRAAHKTAARGGSIARIPAPMPVVESAVFPKEIQGLVNTGLASLNKELNA